MCLRCTPSCVITDCLHQTDRMFDIADVAFGQVSDQEKKAHEGKVKDTGSYQGYKLRQYWVRP